MALDEYDKFDYMAEMARAQRISPKVFEDRIFEELVWNLKVIADALQTIERRFEEGNENREEESENLKGHDQGGYGGGREMKKIPTVFVREYKDHKVVGIKNEFTSEKTKYAFEHGLPTVKWDGSCCAIIDGELYKRYDAKKGRTPPQGAIPCCEADPITGHHPHWVKCDRDNPSDKWFWAAFDTTFNWQIPFDGTYEAVGPHFNGNPYGYSDDILIPHGEHLIDVERTFDGVKRFLEEHNIEGIVFWLDGAPVAKIKRSDFGYPWNAERSKKKGGK